MTQIDIPGVVVREEVGRGSYSVVYRAERDGRNYAVKIPHRAVGYDERTASAFAREATILACISHPNIARVRAAGRTADYPYLVMDFVEGDTLDSRLRAGPLGVAETTRVGLDMASALSEAHRRGLVHQDVKPANIVIGPTGSATLLDFGLMTRVGRSRGDATVGTVVYSAPEQTGMLHREVDERADLYALGAVLYHCLAGSPPFQADDVAELLRLHAVSVPRPLADVRADVPGELAAVVARLLAKDPDDRYSSAWDVVAALAPLVQQGPGMPTPPIAAGGAIAAGAGGGPGASGRLTGLIGRRRERAQLRRAWADCLAGGRTVVTLSGQSGTGKTMLVEELLASPDLVAGHPVLRGRCVVHAAVPLALLRDLIDSYVRELQSVPEPRRRELSDRIVSAAGADAPRLARLHPLLARVLGADATVAAGAAGAAGDADTDDLRFRSVVVAFLGRLARLSNGMIIWVDDAQWLGPADRQLLEDLTASVDASSLLVVNSTRDASLHVAPGLATSEDIALGPLDADEVSQIIDYYLGEITDAAFAREVAVRSSGNPLAVVEYVRAVIDAGLVRPDWGQFTLDRSGLDSLPLPAGVLELIRRRADALSPSAVSVLGVAAVIGRRFDLTLLSAGSASTDAAVTRAMAEAEARQLAAPSGEGTWMFVHDCIHEALLSTTDAAARQAVHRRVVDALEAETGGQRRPYELAQHAIAGDVPPERRFRLTAAAAAAALAAPAPYEAVTFYRAASSAAAEAGVEPDADFEEGFAFACTRTVQAADARTHFVRALRGQHDPRRRARIFLELAWVEFGELQGTAGQEYVARGLAETGRGLPANPVAMAAVSAGRWTVGMLCRSRWTGFGGASGDTRELHEIRRRLYEVGLLCERLRGRLGPTLAFSMSAVTPSQRLGSGEVYLRGHAVSAITAGAFGRRRTVVRDVGWLRGLAAQSTDPSLRTNVFLYTCAALIYAGRNIEGERDYVNILRREARWVETGYYITSYSLLIRSLVLRGCFREAWDICEAQAQSGTTGGERLETAFTFVRARLARILGYPPVAHPGLALGTEHEAERFSRYMICHDLVQLEAEDGEFGPAFDAAVAAGDAVGFRPIELAPLFRDFWVAKARGRLEQARRTPPGPERTRRVRVARHALRDVRWAAIYPPIVADLWVLRAVDRQLADDHDAALHLLDKAERKARDLDLPRVRFDALLERARCLRARGDIDRAETEAELAAQFAGRRGWVARERAVLREFTGIERRSSPERSTRGSPSAGSGRDRHRLDAVLRVSAAASGQLAPESVAAVALDEIISILGADRALLLLPDLPDSASGASGSDRPGSGQLRLYASRTAKRVDDDEDRPEGTGEPSSGDGGLTRFATTVVERVHAEQRPLVVTGTDEGAALGSESAVQYGLRSILAAPVPFDERRSGVIYVDSRVARGLFTAEDAQILILLAKEVGQSLHTAETARLHTLVAAERRQREFAETLRTVTAQAAATLDAREIPRRVLSAARPILPFDAAWVMSRVSGTIRIDSTHGDVADDVVGKTLDIPDDWPLREAFDAGRAAAADAGPGTSELPGQHYPLASWLAAPLPLRHNADLVVVLAARSPGCYGETHVQIARTVIDQTVIAYENAQHFEQLRHYATTDPLTGLANRRQFVEQAERMIAVRVAADLPVSAAMIDIDFFKRVNDTHGHAVGDEVLTEIAQRIRTSLRKEDIIGRVGGEEFAALVPEPLPVAEAVTQRLRHAVASVPVETVAGPLEIHLSVGLTPLSPHDDGLADLLTRADQALYDAKRTGRNRVAVQIRP